MIKAILLAFTPVVVHCEIFVLNVTPVLPPAPPIIPTITSKEIVHLILKVQEIYDTSAIVISHDMACVKNIANRIIMLIDGVCHAEGTYEELMKNKDPLVKDFFE